LIVTGTGTGVGKTVVTAAVATLAAAAGERVVVLKPAQTGIEPGAPGDLADVTRLTGGAVAVRELARYPDPLAPATAARRSGRAPLRVADVTAAASDTAAGPGVDLLLVEGAGGLLVRLNDDGETLGDVATALDAPVLLVASAGLGVLNTAALTAEALDRRHLTFTGTVVGAYPEQPDLAERTNLADLPTVTGAPLLGVLPEGLGRADPQGFTEAARCGLHPVLGGQWVPPLP
jgi:dethiobiotin synthetase